MDKIKRFFECLLPVSVCNLECSYCYLIQENRRTMKMETFDYSCQHIVKALRRERVGGICLFNLCATGETMAQPELIPLIKGLLQEGHYVSITTNGTLSDKFDRLIESCNDLLSHLHVAFSLHYVELKKHGWIDCYFDNVIKMRNAGASILVQVNLCDEYLPYLDEIKQISLEKVGAYPQVALTRNERTTPMSIMTNGTPEEYFIYGKEFESPLFEFTYKNFMVKRTEYCYAGEWSGVLNMKTGVLKKCYAEPGEVNIFNNIESKIVFKPVGCNCHNTYCVNSSHFMSLGIIPELVTPTYAQLRNRSSAKWYSKEMEDFLNSKLAESNKKHNAIEKFILSRSKYSIRQKLSQYKFYQKLHELKVKLRG